MDVGGAGKRERRVVSWREDTGALGYRIYRKTGSGSYSLVKIINDGNISSWTDKTAKKLNTKYTYYVKAFTKNGSKYKYAKNSMERTHRWLKRGLEHFDATPDKYGYRQTFFPIVQGCVYPELRRESAKFIADQGRDGNAIGGLAVGEPTEKMYEMIEVVNEILPKDKPRYLMGVGTPANLLEGIERGVDMFDCVMPTRNGRNGMLFTRNGIMNMKNKKLGTPKNNVPFSNGGDMTKKIVAIGGGENGRITSDGTRKPYETGPIDQEIINLTGKEKPHFLFLAHSQDTIENENSNFETMQAIYNGKYGCECKHLLKDQLNDIEYAKSLVNWADIIYEGGGNTLDMIALWKNTKFDKIL